MFTDITLEGKIFYITLSILLLGTYVLRVIVNKKLCVHWVQVFCPILNLLPILEVAEIPKPWLILSIIPVINAAFIPIYIRAHFNFFKEMNVPTGLAIIASVCPAIGLASVVAAKD